MKKVDWVLYGIPFKDTNNEIEVKIWNGVSINRCRTYNTHFVKNISYKFKKTGMIQLSELKKNMYWVDSENNLKNFFK